MSQDGSWGDSVILRVMSHMWGLKISVVNSRFLRDTVFKHKGTIKKADIVVVYNGINHYTAASMY